MENKKIIAVVGATGAQGRGVVNAILNDPEQRFVARAITRNAGSDKGQLREMQVRRKQKNLPPGELKWLKQMLTTKRVLKKHSRVLTVLFVSPFSGNISPRKKKTFMPKIWQKPQVRQV